MTFLEYINVINIQEDTVITVGNFDGVHIGHQRLIELTVKLGEENNLLPIVFTYQNHPLEYVHGKNVKYLLTDSDKENLILKHKINRVINVPFDDVLKNMSTKEFMEKILKSRLRCRHLVIGADSRFGKGREGEAESIRRIGEKIGIVVHIVSLVTVDNLRVSSTYIRTLIEEGDFLRANRLLGREYSFLGTVIHGRAIGRELGFPTANVDVFHKLVIPANGVYKTLVEWEGSTYYAATNIGYRPTFEGKERTVESCILNFEKDIYGKEIRVYFQERIRSEKKFASKEDLIKQMTEDIDYLKGLILN